MLVLLALFISYVVYFYESDVMAVRDPRAANVSARFPYCLSSQMDLFVNEPLLPEYTY